MSPCHAVGKGGSGVPLIGPRPRLQSLCMRLLVTGVDAAGRSCAARDAPVTLQGDAGLGGILYSVLYATPSAPSIDGGGGRVADFLDLAVPPGSMRWTAIEYAPGATFSMHHTDTVDFDVVLSGSVELILDDGAHLLFARRQRGGEWRRPRLAGGCGRVPPEHHDDRRFARPAMTESGAAQSVDTLRCLISQASPSGTRTSR